MFKRNDRGSAARRTVRPPVLAGRGPDRAGHTRAAGGCPQGIEAAHRHLRLVQQAAAGYTGGLWVALTRWAAGVIEDDAAMAPGHLPPYGSMHRWFPAVVTVLRLAFQKGRLAAKLGEDFTFGPELGIRGLGGVRPTG